MRHVRIAISLPTAFLIIAMSASIFSLYVVMSKPKKSLQNNVSGPTHPGGVNPAFPTQGTAAYPNTTPLPLSLAGTIAAPALYSPGNQYSGATPQSIPTTAPPQPGYGPAPPPPGYGFVPPPPVYGTAFSQPGYGVGTYGTGTNGFNQPSTF